MLLFADGFDHYGPDEDRLFDGVYAEANGVTLSAVKPRTGARSLAINAGTNNAGVRKVLTAGSEEFVGGGFAFSISALPTDNRSLGLFQWRSGANVILASVWITSTGTVVIVAGGRSGTGVAESDPCVFAGAYSHFEAAMNDGEVEVRVNGVTVATGTTAGGAVAQVKVGADSFPLSGAIGITVYVDDFVLWSGGEGVIDDFVGDVKVYTRFPDADGPDQDWTPAIGTEGYPMLDNVPPQDSTEYISVAAEDVPARSTFGIAAFPEEIVAVRGVVLATRAFKTDAGNAKVQTGVISGVAEELSVEHPLSQAPIWFSDPFESDPATSTVWTLESLNALLTIIDRTE